MEDSRRKTPAWQLGEPVLSPTERWALEATRGLGSPQGSGTTCPLAVGDTRAALGIVSCGSQTCSAVLGSELPRGETWAVAGVCDTVSRLLQVLGAITLWHPIP
jgi:hypothetical protein